MNSQSIKVKSTPNGVYIFSLSGILDVGQDEELQYSLIECFDAGSYRIILDFTNTETIFSPVLRVITWASEIVANNEGRLVLAGINPKIFEKLDMIGIEELVEMVPDMEFAMELFQE